MASRVMLCAIAKNEGAYLADWVFHHRYFGFDAIRVFINGTDDTSVEIMESIHSIDPAVDFRVVDDLYQDCVDRQRHFQRVAYGRLGRHARRSGFTHVAFFDLDEYWTPSNLTASIHEFIPDDPEVNVVSFQWGLDVPETGAEEFAPVVSAVVDMQLNPHVKSVVRLDDRVQKLRTHTAVTSSGVRLLVREPFPIRDERGQQYGSFLAGEDFAPRVSEVPEAFILHAIHRSEVEYTATLVNGHVAVGRHQAPDFRSRYKSGRAGYRAAGEPVLHVEFPSEAFAQYRKAADDFMVALDADHLIGASEQFVRDRAAEMLDAAADDVEVMRGMRRALRGVPAPILDAAYPGRDLEVESHVDSVVESGGRVRVDGWAFCADAERELEFALEDGSTKMITPIQVVRGPRPDVSDAFVNASLNSGFSAELSADLLDSAPETVLVIRAVGGTFLQSHRLTSAG